MEKIVKNLTEIVIMEFTVLVGLLFTDIEKKMILTVVTLVFIGYVLGKMYGAISAKKEKEERKKENSKKKFYYKKKGGKR